MELAKDTDEPDLVPRDYQMKLMEIAIKQNSIIFLPTGSGKTFIATMVLRQLGKSLEKPVNEGGKISCLLVNTVALVEQQAKHLRRYTHFTVGEYSGDLNVDNWNITMWKHEINSHHVFVMTAQILLNIVETSILSLNSINLLIFDECHRGVSEHCMRQIMMHFKNVQDPPRVIGLTATLLNKSCKPFQVPENVKALETTFHSKIATVDELRSVLGYRTNPTEIVKVFKEHESTCIEKKAVRLLNDLIDHLIKTDIVSPPPTPKKGNLILLDPEKGLKSIINVIQDTIIHINMLGTFGGQIAVLAHMVQMERIKKSSQTKQLTLILDCIITTLTVVHKLFGDELKHYSDKDKVVKFSSHQVYTLLDTIRDYKMKSKESLCGIIFVKRRFTAKILYYILLHLKNIDSEFSDLNPNFMVGFNNNPYNDTREGLYNVKMNRKVLSQFVNKEINLMVASDVLEEGVDIPTCTFVTKFDKPDNYRSYIQSKGRARHNRSFFYMLVDAGNVYQFASTYKNFQEVENTLNDLFIGQNELRDGPSDDNILDLYDEHVLPPYYVNGPGSAQVNLLSAISLLCRYCTSLPSDCYTIYNPNWYVQCTEVDFFNCVTNINKNKYKVFIELPIICPLSDPIEGPSMFSKKLAKRAAALEACKLLHKAGELDDMLLPKRHTVIEEDTNDFFKHWPEVKEKTFGHGNSFRIYPKQVPIVLNKQIQPLEQVYLHLIELNPLFTYDSLNSKMIYDLYTSSLCYGLISCDALPDLCEFPLYVSAGQINVNIVINKATITLTTKQLQDLKEFHWIVFRDLLKLLKTFLVMDNGANVEGMLIVPVQKNSAKIDFDIIDSNKCLFDQKKEPKEQEKMNLHITEENYLSKIVTPWYRPDDTTYLVTAICTDLSALSEFPSEDYNTYIDYFSDKYHARILKPSQPLLLVKAISKRLNCLKPRGITSKRNKDKTYEDLEEHLIPELVIKQDFPPALWLQAKLLPSILHRMSTLLLAEELRLRIATESGLGVCRLPSGQKWKPLCLDRHLIKYKYEESPRKPKRKLSTCEPETIVDLPKLELLQLIQDFNIKKLERDYPWLEKDEPVDIERNLNVTLMDIQYYENFVTQTVTLDERNGKHYKDRKTECLAITYNKDFIEKQIELLKPRKVENGPELVDVFKAFVTAKANDVVNMERSETLGDSFLKLSISLFIMLRFPRYEEGRSTTLKSRIISNKNLYYIALNKQLCGYIKNCDFTPSFEWKPPYFCVPEVIKDKINNKLMTASSIFTFYFSKEEQLSGNLTSQNIRQIEEFNELLEENKNENTYDSILAFFGLHKLKDKSIADCVEGLLGVYFESCGFEGGLKLLKWLEIIPKAENIDNLLQQEIPSPILNPNATIDNVDLFIPSWKAIEQRLGYNFNNRAFLLQALTHSSFTSNRVTSCYQKLEFLGDAVLDFLITCHIYETCDGLSPGDLTDLRSALVNNITFAGFAVRCGFHKFLLYSNSHLEELIDNFVQFQEGNSFEINDDVLILLEENDLYLAQHVDVPKVLGDLFEALAGAIFLDSGMKLETVWNVFYRIMWKEIESFKNNVPKNPIRLLYETIGAHPEFLPAVSVKDGGTMVPLDFMLNGVKKRVYGFGENKSVAKRAAAKIALRLIHK